MATSQLKPFAERRALDWYPTPQALADLAVTFLPSPQNKAIVLDPGCGTGVWGSAARKTWGSGPILHGIDIGITPRNGIYNFRQRRDFMAFARSTAARYDYVIGNPPYLLAEEFVKLGCNLLKSGGHLLFLLRLNFLGGQKRGSGLFKVLPPRHVFVSCRRPDFTGGGGDMTEYGLFWWTKDWNAPTTLSWFDFALKQTAGQLTLFAEVGR